jgi:integrase
MPPVIVTRRLNEAIPLQTIKRRVHLADVQRPRSTRARLELLPQLVAIMRPLIQQGQQAISNRHDTQYAIPGMQHATDTQSGAPSRDFHDLRHTAATIWLKNGVDIKTVQAWLGHASAKLTLDTYAHYMGTNADLTSIALLNTALGYAGGTRVRKLGTAK